MNYIKKLNSNYYLYSILFFIFLPLNYLPQMWDAVSIDYGFRIKDIGGLEIWYQESGRPFHLLFIYIIKFFSEFFLISHEILVDSITVFFLILLCVEVKKYSKFFFRLEDKWCNLAAFFTSIFPIWHILVAFNITLHLISLYFLILGYRYFVDKKIIKVIFGLFFILLSFTTESTMSLLIGIMIGNFFLDKKNNTKYFSLYKLIFIVLLCFFYYFIFRISLISGIYENYNTLNLNSYLTNIFWLNLIKNFFNFTTYLLIFIWIPVVFIIHLKFTKPDKMYFRNFSLKYFSDYFILILLSAFAVFPYLILNKSSSIFYLSDYYQRHALLLAPIFGIFFSIMYKDLHKIDFFTNRIHYKAYLSIFIIINLLLLNYGTLRKFESHFFKFSLTNKIINFGELPGGKVMFIGENIPADLRNKELNHLLFNAYNKANWWSSTFGSANFSNVPSYFSKDDRYSKLYISKDYINECLIYIYLKDDLTKVERIKKFYIFKYKKYYNIDKIVKKC